MFLKFIVYIIFSLPVLIHAQSDWQGEWLSENLKSLIIKKDSIQFDFNEMKYQINKDTLIGFERMIFSLYGEKRNVDTIMTSKFIVLRVKDKIKLTTTDLNGQIFMTGAKSDKKNHKRYTFMKKDALEKIIMGRKKIKLKQLAFSRTGGEMDFTNLKYHISNKGDILFWGKIDTKVHPEYPFNGCYMGKLSSEDFISLKKLLCKSALKRVERDWLFPTCISYYQLSLEDENGFAKFQGGLVPEYCMELINFLDNLYQKVDWKKTSEDCTFDFLERKPKKN
jgi:hypothetical protein